MLLGKDGILSIGAFQIPIKPSKGTGGLGNLEWVLGAREEHLLHAEVSSELLRINPIYERHWGSPIERRLGPWEKKVKKRLRTLEGFPKTEGPWWEDSSSCWPCREFPLCRSDRTDRTGGKSQLEVGYLWWHYMASSWVIYWVGDSPLSWKAPFNLFCGSRKNKARTFKIWPLGAVALP